MRTKYFSLVIAGLLAVIATGCIVSVEPRRAVNPVGTEHTVTVTLRDPEQIDEELICQILEDIYEEIVGEPPPEECLILQPVQSDLMYFYIESGPNAGLNSENSGICNPSCELLNEVTSWTYRSNGVPGTDVIVACVNYVELLGEIIIGIESEVEAQEPSEDELEKLIVDAINDALGTDYETFIDMFCQRVSKTWVERQPNIGAGLSGLFQGQPTPLPTAAAPAPAVTTPIRPPSTGDAGLR